MKSIKEALENRNHLPAYLEYADAAFEGKYVRLPERAELSQDIDEKQIVEFYNR
ncbi:30S ribosomal protein S4 [compost metagenome]